MPQIELISSKTPEILELIITDECKNEFCFTEAARPGGKKSTITRGSRVFFSRNLAG